MSSDTEDRLCLVPFEAFTQVAFEREFFRRQMLQCEVALRHSTQLADSLRRCLEFWNCSAGLPTHSSELCLPAKHRASISLCTHNLVDFCDEIIRMSHNDLLLQCTSAAISEASDQAHTRALSLANAAEAKALKHSIESECIKGELAASQHMVSVLRRRVDALEHLLDQERQHVHAQCVRQAEECASAILLQSQSLLGSTSLRIDALASQLKQNETRLARLRSSLQLSQAHSERVQKGSDSMSRQLETAELELCDLRLKHESSLAAAREYEAKVAEKDDMIRLLDQQCALYERMLPIHSLEKARAAQPASKSKKQTGPFRASSAEK